MSGRDRDVESRTGIKRGTGIVGESEHNTE